MLKKLFVLSIVGFLVAVALFFWANNMFHSAGDYAETKHIVIEKGTGTSGIINKLAEEGAVSSPSILKVMARMKGINDLRYGEYLIEPGMSPAQIFEKIRRGEVVVRKITVAEGKTVYEVLEILQAAEGLTGELPTNVKEGSLLPQTYYYQYGDTYDSVIKQMQDQMSEIVKRLWEFRRMDIPVSTPEEAVILASVVEKETGNADERYMVASVFTNRLRIGMPLQSDPTSVYGITAGAPLGRLPTGADMRDENPYNTYKIKGLPPGPICNPGADSIEAVLNPADTNYLYFVADGAGGHNFSTGLKEHNQNVNVYRKVRNEEKRAAASGLSARQKSEMIIRPGQ